MHTGQIASRCCCICCRSSCTECSRAASSQARPALFHHALQQSLAVLHRVQESRDLPQAVYSRSALEHSVAEHRAFKKNMLSPVQRCVGNVPCTAACTLGWLLLESSLSPAEHCRAIYTYACCVFFSPPLKQQPHALSLLAAAAAPHSAALGSLASQESAAGDLQQPRPEDYGLPAALPHLRMSHQTGEATPALGREAAYAETPGLVCVISLGQPISAGCRRRRRASGPHAELRGVHLLPLPAHPGPALPPHLHLKVEGAKMLRRPQRSPRCEAAHAGWPMACNLISGRDVPSTPAHASCSCGKALAAHPVSRLTAPLALRFAAGVLKS